MRKSMDRRKFLIALSTVMGSAMSPLASTALKAAETFEATGQLRVLTAQQSKLLERIADIIIPETDTPGAAAVGVHFYIDHMVASWMAKDHAARFIAGLEILEKTHAGFLSISSAQQTVIVQKLDDEMWEGPHADFYREVKELVLVGYYTSEVGASVELAYDPVPGPFHSVTIEEFDRKWST
ncbi:MAG: gluconate 2-dehydrogenase subunit 3 family protein [Parvibaculaceae bacterium]|nr:gluconate 2-dehydrogenase subunit 3 family protein [Parvibaculaceae bacterium]